MPDNAQYTLDDFAESLIKAKQYKSISPEIHEELKKDILRRAHEFLLAKSIAKLSDDQAKELNGLIEKGAKDEELQTYLEQAIPNSVDFITDVLTQFRQVYMGLE